MPFRNKGANRYALATPAALAVMILFVLLFGGGIAPYSYEAQSRGEPNAPVSSIHFFNDNGDFRLRPFVHIRRLADPLNYEYVELKENEFPVEFLIRGDVYSVAGLFGADLHLFGVESDSAKLNILGTDSLGRDRFSRLMIAARFSLAVCLTGTGFASLIGIAFGAISGYSGRRIDGIMMGIADSVIALPTLILVLAARAAFPLELPPLRAATLLVLIFGFTGWAEMARLARGLVRAARKQEYVQAAKAGGCSATAILARHIFPNIAPPLLTQMTLMLPAFLLSEVALSFLGVGLQEPVPSLGNMLAAASDLNQLRQHPILLLSPAILIFIFVLLARLASARFQAVKHSGSASLV